MLPKAWQEQLNSYVDEASFAALMAQVEEAYQTETVYPPREQVFRALEKTAPESLRVVILGQDPYHEKGQAHGLAFSVPGGVKYPPSLRNIFTELQDDLSLRPANEGDLSSWAEQGVLLLNAVLTVQEGKAGSHGKFGWQDFTDAIIESLSELPQPIAFVLWGAYAQKKAGIAEKSAYPRLILQSPHPSPLSSYRGFFGSKPFSKVNEFLVSHGEAPIAWGV